MSLTTLIFLLPLDDVSSLPPPPFPALLPSTGRADHMGRVSNCMQRRSCFVLLSSRTCLRHSHHRKRGRWASGMGCMAVGRFVCNSSSSSMQCCSGDVHGCLHSTVGSSHTLMPSLLRFCAVENKVGFSLFHEIHLPLLLTLPVLFLSFTLLISLLLFSFSRSPGGKMKSGMIGCACFSQEDAASRVCAMRFGRKGRWPIAATHAKPPPMVVNHI